MKKLIGAALVATLMGSLSANAEVILDDHFTVPGGANTDINAEILAPGTRQSGGSVISGYSLSGTATTPSGTISDPLGNGGTATLSGTFNDVNDVRMAMNTDFGSSLAGQEWSLSFTMYSPVGATFVGWAGFGLSTTEQPNNAPFGELGIFFRPAQANIAIDNFGGFQTVATTHDPFTSIMDYQLVVNEATGMANLSYDAFSPTTLALLGSEDLGSFAITLPAGGLRGIDFAMHADSGTDAAGTLYLDDIVIETIPEPATFGLVAAFGGAMVFIRRKIMI